MWNVVREIRCINAINGLEVMVREMADMVLIEYSHSGGHAWHCGAVKFETEAGQQCIGDHGLFKVQTTIGIALLLSVDDARATYHSNPKKLEASGRNWVTEETALATNIEARMTSADHVTIHMTGGMTMRMPIHDAQKFAEGIQNEIVKAVNTQRHERDRMMQEGIR